MIMDSNYSWNQPEHNGPAQKIWSKVLNNTLKEKIINQSQQTVHHFNNGQNEIPIYSAFSQNIRDSWHNPPMRIEDYDLSREKDKNEGKSRESFIAQFLQIVKKKRDYNKGSTYGYELQMQIGMISTLNIDLYPWNVEKRKYGKNIAGLHQEVLDFYQYIMPSKEEQLMRQEVIARLKDVVTSEWPDAEVDVFGSFKTELHLPTSDIDVVIFGKWDNPLWKLNDIIKRSGIASDCKVLDKATVPIVKMTDKESDVRIDISFNMSNGIKSAELIKSYIKQYPQLPQLVLLLKQYLLQRDLNEVWTGGISSYSLILMCVSFMKHCTKKKLDISNLGRTLILFLEMYGRNFDYSNTGIRTSSDISYVPKEDIMKNMDGTQWSSILCIEDPLNPGNDIGRSSYGALHVKLAFDYAYSNLVPLVLPQSAHLYDDHISILGRIIRITPEVVRYRAFIKKKYSSDCRPVLPGGPVATALSSDQNNTNNSNQKCSIGERGDVPSNNTTTNNNKGGNVPAMSVTSASQPTKMTTTTTGTKVYSYKKTLMGNLDQMKPGQVRVSAAVNDLKNNSSNSSTKAPLTTSATDQQQIQIQIQQPPPPQHQQQQQQVHNRPWKKNRPAIFVNCAMKRD